MTPRFHLRRAFNGILDVLYPDSGSTCRLCQRPFEESAESLLQQLLQPNHVRTSGSAHFDTKGVCPFCLQDAHECFDRVYVRKLSVEYVRDGEACSAISTVCAAGKYSGIVRNAIRRWKYDGVIELTNWFAEWTRRAHETLRRQGIAAEYNGMDAVVPVPPSRDRFRKRGYDHTALLARKLERITHLPTRTWLEREQAHDGHFTQSQTAKNAAERLRSLRGVYRAHDLAAVLGKRILLLDDIVTTGATLRSCASALFSAGATQVHALVIANVE